MSHDFRPEQDPDLDETPIRHDSGLAFLVGVLVFLMGLAAFGAAAYLALYH